MTILALQLRTKSPKINLLQVLLLLLATISIFLLTNYFTAKQIHNINILTIEKAKNVAEEVFKTGDVGLVAALPLDAALIKKLQEELSRILAKDTDYNGCEVYFLNVQVPGEYPVLAYGNVIIGGIQLNTGEVWKIGQTCNGEDDRYRAKVYYKGNGIVISDRELIYTTIMVGTYKECLILEKILIYTYSIWSGHAHLLKPPGCKIFR